MNQFKFALTFGLGILLAAHGTFGADAVPASPSLSILKSVPLAELPGKAAALVAAADSTNQIQTTIDVVKAAIGLNPAAARAIVGTIAVGTPEMAGVAAATAAGLLPKQAAMLAQVAAAAAPKQAGNIVEAVCRATPDAYRAIALAVAEAAPDAARQILAGVAAALPELKTAIANSLATYQNTIPSVTLVLAQIEKPSGLSLLAAGTPGSISTHSVNPTPGPAFAAPPSTPVVLDAGNAGQVPTGGRNYANPTPVGGNYSP
jgi:hypothetical protein